MAMKLKNIIEDIAKEILTNALSLRYDICTCPRCRNDMLAYVLSRVPAKYVTTEAGALHTIIDQTRVEKEAEVAKAVISAITAISTSPRHETKENKEQTFQLLLDKIYEDRGLDFRHYYLDILKRRVAIRMRANNVSSFSDYLMLLIKTPQEYDKLFAVLCINVSEFFRDQDVWEKLKEIFGNIIQNKKQQNSNTITIWSAACASGEEPYSIVMLLKEFFKDQLGNFKVIIHATDIDPKALKAAHKAEYPKANVKNVPEKLLKLYFTLLSTGEYKLKDEIKQMVAFRSLDLISSDFIRNTDIIFCRNVFIYFTRSLQDQLLMKFYKSLNTGGYLVLGKSETMWPEAKEIYEAVDLKTHIYKRVTT